MFVQRDDLKRWLEDGLSLNQISALTGRDASTVGYWIQKHGLVANGRAKFAARGGIGREELEPLVAGGATLREIAATLDRSIPTVRYWIAKHGLEAPHAVRRREREIARADGRRTISGNCRVHGATTFVLGNSGRARCRQCRMDAVARWRRNTKAKLVAEAGGKCRLCGYDRCQAALEFHHLDPSSKSFALSVRGLTRSIEKLREEVAKCVLLCANCHAEVEVGQAQL